MNSEKKFATKKAEELYEKITSYRIRMDRIKKDEMASDLQCLSLIWNDLSSGMRKFISSSLAGGDSTIFENHLNELSDDIYEANKVCDDLKIATESTK